MAGHAGRALGLEASVLVHPTHWRWENGRGEDRRGEENEWMRGEEEERRREQDRRRVAKKGIERREKEKTEERWKKIEKYRADQDQCEVLLNTLGSLEVHFMYKKSYIKSSVPVLTTVPLSLLNGTEDWHMWSGTKAGHGTQSIGLGTSWKKQHKFDVRLCRQTRARWTLARFPPRNSNLNDHYNAFSVSEIFRSDFFVPTPMDCVKFN